MATLTVFLKRFLLFIALLILVLIVTLTTLTFIGVKIDLGFLKAGVETSAKAALGRDVRIAGPVVFEFSDWPAIRIEDVQIANVPGAKNDVFFHAGFAKLQLSLFPLFKGKIHIGQIKAEDVTLYLESDKEGKPNWEFGNDSVPEPALTEEGSRTQNPEGAKRKIGFEGVDNIDLKNISAQYHDAALNKTIDFTLTKLQGKAPLGKPITINLNGELQEESYTIAIKGNSIDKLLSGGKELWEFTLEGDFAGKEIGAKGDMVVHAGKPTANLAFGIKDINVGQFLERAGLVQGLDASTGTMGVSLSIKGNSLKEAIEESTFRFVIEDGQWKIKNPASESFIEVDDLDGDITIQQGNAIKMSMSGTVDSHPVSFVITGAPLAEYLTALKKVPLTIEAEFADSYLRFTGELVLPITSKNLKLGLLFKTERLDNLNDLLSVELPPLGPISFETELSLSAKKFDLPVLDIMVGKSELQGKMYLDQSQEIPQAGIEVVSDLLRIDDFGPVIEMLRESPEQVAEEGDEKAVETDVVEKSSSTSNKSILSHEVLSSFNAKLHIEAKEVTSGPDTLGSGIINISVKDTQLAVSPVHLNVPGGSVNIEMDYLPTENDISFNLQADIEKFDLGIMARRFKPETDMGGLLTLSSEIHSKAPSLNTTMENAEGHFDFALVPQNFSSGIIDMWAVNLISSIMSEVSEEDQSHINCVVVRLGMEDGIMEEKAIYMDTSKMNVSGKADIDFKQQRFQIYMEPEPKRPEFFSLAIPIEVKGTFQDFGFKLGVINTTTTVVSFLTSPLTVPFRRIFSEEIPEDGVEACKQAWAISAESE